MSWGCVWQGQVVSVDHAGRGLNFAWHSMNQGDQAFWELLIYTWLIGTSGILGGVTGGYSCLYVCVHVSATRLGLGINSWLHIRLLEPFKWGQTGLIATLTAFNTVLLLFNEAYSDIVM